MRLVELKQDVVILLDSMTRLARAYNLTINPTGRTLSGGLDPGALYGPKDSSVLREILKMAAA
jgi:transcription termination factor Rho